MLCRTAKQSSSLGKRVGAEESESAFIEEIESKDEAFSDSALRENLVVEHYKDEV